MEGDTQTASAVRGLTVPHLYILSLLLLTFVGVTWKSFSPFSQVRDTSYFNADLEANSLIHTSGI